MKIQFTLNGQARQVDCEAHESLMAVLRRNSIWSVKHGCETGECGACSVLIDGKLTPTCVMLAGQADGHNLVTVEALAPSHSADGRGVSALQQAFIDTGAIQCGYCTAGMIMAAAALLYEHPDPSVAQIRSALARNVCRCCAARGGLLDVSPEKALGPHTAARSRVLRAARGGSRRRARSQPARAGATPGFRC